jgi:hypothetical protein
LNQLNHEFDVSNLDFSMNLYGFFILLKGGVVEKRWKRAKHLHDFCTKEILGIRNCRTALPTKIGRGVRFASFLEPALQR